MNSIFRWKAFEKQRRDNLFFGDMGNSAMETGGLSHPVQCCQYDIFILHQMDNTWAFEAAELWRHWYLLIGKGVGSKGSHATKHLFEKQPHYNRLSQIIQGFYQWRLIYPKNLSENNVNSYVLGVDYKVFLQLLTLHPRDLWSKVWERW